MRKTDHDTNHGANAHGVLMRQSCSRTLRLNLLYNPVNCSTACLPARGLHAVHAQGKCVLMSRVSHICLCVVTLSVSTLVTH